MPTVPTHALVATTILAGLARRRLAPALWIAGAVCAVLPDIDVIGFAFGIRYGDLLGHRGLTHSIGFAAGLASVVTFGLRRHVGDIRLDAVWGYLFLCTLSHGVLDAATSGGRGIAFFSPLSNARYFWPWQPIAVSPIGIRFFSSRGLSVISSELRWIWLPCLAIIVAAWVSRTVARSKGRERADGVLTPQA